MVQKVSKKLHGDCRLSTHFKVKEFACKDGTDEVKFDTELVMVLERVRALSGNKPCIINSGYRTPAYNKLINGATNSMHIEGKAADIHISGLSPLTVAKHAETALKEFKIPGGIGRYSTFTHVDVRANKWREDFVTGKKGVNF